MIPASVQDRLRRFDPALRLREVRGADPQDSRKEVMLIALERQDRAGNYQRIGTVRPDLLGDGSGLLAKLKSSDIREYGGGMKAADAFDEADRVAVEKRKQRRQDKFSQMGKEAYDYIARRTGRRVNSAGMPKGETT